MSECGCGRSLAGLGLTELRWRIRNGRDDVEALRRELAGEGVGSWAAKTEPNLIEAELELEDALHELWHRGLEVA